MQGEKILESLIEVDGEQVCIIRDYFERNAPECGRCGLRAVCTRPLTEEQLERVIDKLNKQIYRREFYEDLGDFYDDETYSEV